MSNRKERKQIEYDLAFFLEPYKQFAEDYSRLKEKEYFNKDTLCWKITHKKASDIVFFCFAAKEPKAKNRAFYALKGIHPAVTSVADYTDLRAVRVPAFHKYGETGRIPIKAFLKEGYTFPCSLCGNDNFTYNDYETGRCFIVENDRNLNSFTEGFIVCYNCKKKLEE